MARQVIYVPHLADPLELPVYRNQIDTLCREHSCRFESRMEIEHESMNEGERAKIVTLDDLDVMMGIVISSGACDYLCDLGSKEGLDKEIPPHSDFWKNPDHAPFKDGFRAAAARNAEFKVLREGTGLTIDNQLILRYDLTLGLQALVKRIMTCYHYRMFTLCLDGVVRKEYVEWGKSVLRVRVSKEDLLGSKQAFADAFFYYTYHREYDITNIESHQLLDQYRTFLMLKPFKAFYQHFGVPFPYKYKYKKDKAGTDQIVEVNTDGIVDLVMKGLKECFAGELSQEDEVDFRNMATPIPYLADRRRALGKEMGKTACQDI
ncbi:MAG: hypothetical protein AAGB46_10430 [Verrucomicrobiota bacterium]